MPLDFECTQSFSIGIMNNNLISIGELSRLTGLSTHTLRYYEAAGVLQPIGRAANGHRRYRSNDVLWLEFVLKLKLTGMPLVDIKQYAQLRTQGDATLSPRLAMLQLHRKRLLEKIAGLAQCANALDAKIRTYKQMISKSKAHTRKVKS